MATVTLPTPETEGSLTLGRVPSTLSQAFLLSRYQLRDYLRSRRFILMMAIVAAIAAILTFVLSYFNSSYVVQGALARRERIMGFGHRVYKTVDPRSQLAKKLLRELLEKQGKGLETYQLCEAVENAVLLFREPQELLVDTTDLRPERGTEIEIRSKALREGSAFVVVEVTRWAPTLTPTLTSAMSIERISNALPASSPLASSATGWPRTGIRRTISPLPRGTRDESRWMSWMRGGSNRCSGPTIACRERAERICIPGWT
jgi:hypothetical protein